MRDLSTVQISLGVIPAVMMMALQNVSPECWFVRIVLSINPSNVTNVTARRER